MNRLLKQFIPFIYLGFVIVLFVLGIILFSYILIWGAVVGLVLFVIQWIRMKFFPPKYLARHQDHSRPGRTFDHKE